MGSGSRALARWRRIPGPPRDAVKARLLRLYVALEARFGPQRWWPARTAYEVAAGAILTQFTSWLNAKRAIGELRARRLLSPARLAAVSEDDLGGALRVAGTYRLKARRLRAFTAWLLERFDGRFEEMRRLPLGPLRQDLLMIPGVGPETADVILLYAVGRPVFVVDEYARRVLGRHRLMRRGLSYEAARAFLEVHLPSDPALFGEYHALLVAVGKAYCRATPDCMNCPLRFDLLKSGGAQRRSSPTPPTVLKSGGAPRRSSPTPPTVLKSGGAPRRSSPTPPTAFGELGGVMGRDRRGR
jgi:endonuclease III related protein